MLSPPPQKDRPFVLHQWMAEARKLHAEGKLEDAASYYSAILKAQPRNIDAKHLLGLLRMQQGKFTESVRLLRQVLRISEKSELLEANLGDALRQQGKTKEALRHYNEAININPSYAEVHVNRGLALSQLGQTDAAIAAYTTAVQLKPSLVEGLNNRGTALQQQGHYTAALVDFDTAANLQPENAKTLYNLGNCLRALGRRQEALAAYDRAIKLDPGDVNHWNNRGNLLREMARPTDALHDFDQALRLDPRNVPVLNNRGVVLNELGRSDEAIACYRSLLELKPDFALAYNNLGDLLSGVGRFDDARAVLRHAIALRPGYSEAYLNLSSIHRFTAGDELVSAMIAARKTADEPASKARFDFALGKAHVDIGAYEDAFRYYAEGAAVRRRLLPYDEVATLALISGFKTVFTPEFVERHRAAGDPDQRPIFILGMPRSGTSLIEQILASHPAVRGGGELMALSRAMRPLMLRDGVFPLNLSSISVPDIKEFAASYMSEVAAFLPMDLRVTDKMPLNFYFVGMIALAMPNARIIHATRNPIDTCLSCFMQHFTEGHEFSNDLEELGRYWRAYADLMAHWRRVLGPDAFIDVAYEDIVADLEGEARRMLDYVGLEWDDRCLSFHKSKRTVRTASVAQVRQPIYKTSVERWRVYEPWIGPLLEALDLDV